MSPMTMTKGDGLTQAFQNASGNPKASGDPQWRKRFNKGYDALMSVIWCSSEIESIHPQTVSRVKDAFASFLETMGWIEAGWCFEELLKEKTSSFEYRADGRTPNWYHEFRQCLYFLSMVRSGYIREQDIRRYGGCSVALGTILRHDSWEDFGNDRDMILKHLVEKIMQLPFTRTISNGRSLTPVEKAAEIAQCVDFLTRKAPVLDSDGKFIIKDNGKFLKADRFKGQLNLYYNHILRSPLSTISKFFDGIEGMSTRIGVSQYTVEDDKKYTNERRMIYGRRGLDTEAIKAHSSMGRAIEAADAMLGILLTSLETVNDYTGDPTQNPDYAVPIRINRYIRHATKAFRELPPAFHPVFIFMERMQAKAVRDGDGRMDKLISNAFRPAFAPHFGQINIYSPVSPQPLAGLPAQELSVPVMA